MASRTEGSNLVVAKYQIPIANYWSLVATMKLLIALHHRFPLWQVPPWFSERLRHDFPQLEVVHLSDYERVMEEIPDADIAISWSLRGEQIKAAKRLRWIHSTAAAVHSLMTPELRATDIIVTNARDVHGPVVAEHAVALAFALAKRLPQAVKYQQQKHWGQMDLWYGEPRPRELNGATMTIVGLGGIGRPLAKMTKALGMTVVGVREHPERGRESADVVYGYDELSIALAVADFVVLAAPVTPKTHHLMNAERLAQLKPDAYLINVGRGVLIDEDALVTALRAKSFAGAALDVSTEEPLPQDYPLWAMENVFITPHIAGLTDKMWERHYQHYTENLRRFLAGEPLLWAVDKEKGY
ncbi:MAG: D-2-hydroxyacid dehydrogenase [Acidobacteriota bacterium]|nr:D-2-hydroxyacid dehydrogenase [Acidobacteriota bacterium]